MRYLLFIVCGLLVLPSSAVAQETISGPILADVVKVRDGDSIVVLAHIWPGQTVRVSVRLRGIDAPELKGKCQTEIRKANRAKLEVVRLVGTQPVQLLHVSGGKYFGRVLANVVTGDGTNINRHLLQQKLVRKYSGRKRTSWCNLSSATES